VHANDPSSSGAPGVANLVWTSPADGTVSISGAVWLTRKIGRANDWLLLHDGVPLSTGTVSSHDPYSRANPFDLAFGSGGPAALVGIRVSAGDVIELRLQKAASSPFSDYSGVRLAIDLFGSACSPPPATLTSWWAGDADGGDLIGGNDGTLHNGAAAGDTRGLVGGAFALDGVDDYVQVLNPANLPLGASPRTITLWFKSDKNLILSTESSFVTYGTAVNGQMFGLITSYNAPGRFYPESGVKTADFMPGGDRSDESRTSRQFRACHRLAMRDSGGCPLGSTGQASKGSCDVASATSRFETPAGGTVV
jgi:hypothetical protein